jgi:hypothetical protein
MTILPIPEPPPPPPFSWLSFIGGLVFALIVGGFANIFSGLAGMATGMKLVALFIGAIPGAIFALLSIPASKNGFSQGLLVGGCIVGLIGGICGAGMVGTSFH